MALCTFLSKNVFSQSYYYNDDYYNTNLFYEFGVGLGAMNCITDIGGANTDNAFYINEIKPKTSYLSTSLYASVLYRDFVGIRLEGTFGRVGAADSTITGKSNNLVSKRVRNLSFRSKIAEITFLGEIHPLELINFHPIPYFSPYLLGGLGYFSFNPQAQLNGTWIDLQPLSTEGQGFEEYPDRKPYSLSQFNIPMGFGVRYEMSQKVNLRVEFLHRRLFTDYLDDASNKKLIDPALFSKYLSPVQAQNARSLYNRSLDGSPPIFRGHVQNKDSYMTLSLKLGIVLGRESSTRRSLKCF